MRKMQMVEATLTALLPGNRKGANKNAARMVSISALSSAPPGGLSDTSQPSHDECEGVVCGSEPTDAAGFATASCGAACTASLVGAIAASMMLGEREQAARSPQKDKRHQENVGAKRQFRREEADIIGGQAHQDCADETAADRA